MRSSSAFVIVGLVVFGLTGLTTAASAAATNLYLMGNGEPSASLSLQAPPPGSPISVVVEPSSAGAAETNSARYQQWTYDMSGMTASVNTFTIWAKPADPDGERPVAFGVYVLDCAQSCTVLATNSKTLPVGAQTWTKVILSVKAAPTEFAHGHSLVVKLTVLNTSAGNMGFAFGTSEYPSALHLGALLTTSTTTTTTVPPTTTTTAPTTATTTVPPTTTTTAPTTATTTVPPTTKTTAPPTTTTKVPPTTTTTTARSKTSTTSATTSTTVPATTTTTTETEQGFVVGGSSGSPPRSVAAHLDFGDDMPEMVTLSGSIDMPSDGERSIEVPRRAGLRPEEGLGVVFSSVSEAFSLYWQIAVALGLLMSTLLMVGFANLEIPRASPNTSERIRRIR